jgi:hypothetical protein
MVVNDEARERTGERGLPLWPKDKPLPKFQNRKEESDWWEAHDVEAHPEAVWEAVEHQPSRP